MSLEFISCGICQDNLLSGLQGFNQKGMATPDQPVKNSRPLSTIVDALSKGVAALAILLYAFGFVIVSISHSKYGFIETNLFRPKILAAGAWFLIFTGIPIATVASMSRGRLPWIRFAQLLYPYYMGSLLLAFLSSIVFRFSITSNPDSQISWWFVIGSVAALGLLIFLSRSKKFPPDISAVASILLVLFLVQYTVHEVFITHNFELAAISLWFFGVGVVTQVELNVRSWNLTNADWTKTLFTILGALLVFASYYYPHMKSSWGGGAPINVVLYFNKESSIKPNQSLSVQLVEESDAGFYIVGQGENRAIFVPRNSVSLLYFSDKPSDSTLLH